MSFFEILEIIVIILCVVAYGFMLYFKVRGNIVGAVSELIALAEKTGLAGREKMAQVVEALYDKVPSLLRKILNKNRLQAIAQWIFDWMREYANAYIEASKDDDTAEESKATAVEIGTEAIAELVAELMNAGLAELQEKAKEYGVITDGLKTKKEYVQAIIRAAINKA